MLLIDNHQTKSLGLKARLNHRVRANEHRIACCVLRIPLWRMVAARLVGSGAELNIDVKRAKPIREVREVLFGQDFCWGHYRHIEATLERHEGAASSDDRFAGANISLKQPAHRMHTRHIRPKLPQDFSLRLRQSESQSREERFDQAVVAAAGQASRFYLKIPPPVSHPDLQVQKLIKRKPLS